MTRQSKPRRMTVAEFLAWAPAQPRGRYELVRGKPMRLPNETAGHCLAKCAVSRALGDVVQRAKLPYFVFGSGLAVVVNDEHVRDPDGSVQSKAGTDLEAVTLDEPLIVVEVTWPPECGEGSDKLVEYFSVPSIQHYLIVNPTKKVVVHHARGQGGKHSTLIASPGEISLTPPGMTVPVAELLPQFA